MATLDQELEQAKRHKTFVCYEAEIERIMRKWVINNDIARYIEKKSLSQEEFGEKIGITWSKS